MVDCITTDALRRAGLKSDNLVMHALLPPKLCKEFTQQCYHVRLARPWLPVQQTAKGFAPGIDVASAIFHFLDHTFCDRGNCVKLSLICGWPATSGSTHSEVC